MLRHRASNGNDAAFSPSILVSSEFIAPVIVLE